ncbi:MAG: DUF1707 and DUF2154 domain-containing protein [Spirochaetaceae bacterium]|nr:MAG: DUF1707 and DUF2154 domain-containing protein [Spirochaetaceae bacterium]
MDTLEEEREKALDYLTDCYARAVLDLRQYEDRRDQVMAAASVREIRRAIEGTEQTVADSGRKNTTGVPEQTALCIMGTRKLTPVSLASEAKTVCVMGDVVVDLRRTAITGPARVMTVTIMGDTVIRVPGNAIVHNEITAIMADVKEKDAPTADDGPEIYLTGIALMADVKIRRG